MNITHSRQSEKVLRLSEIKMENIWYIYIDISQSDLSSYPRKYILYLTYEKLIFHVFTRDEELIELMKLARFRFAKIF